MTRSLSLSAPVRALLALMLVFLVGCFFHADGSFLIVGVLHGPDPRADDQEILTEVVSQLTGFQARGYDAVTAYF